MSSSEAGALLAEPMIRRPLWAHAAAWFPEECCALLVTGDEGPRLILADNLAARPSSQAPAGPGTGYRLDPRLIVAAEARGERLVAIIHSHCEVGAYFSAEDASAALTPDGTAPLFPGVEYVVLDAQPSGVVGFKVFGWDAARGLFAERCDVRGAGG